MCIYFIEISLEKKSFNKRMELQIGGSNVTVEA